MDYPPPNQTPLEVGDAVRLLPHHAWLTPWDDIALRGLGGTVTEVSANGVKIMFPPRRAERPDLAKEGWFSPTMVGLLRRGAGVSVPQQPSLLDFPCDNRPAA